ncbi:MAG: sulfatase-like hydrolase/transferase [Candidatus Lokiarchaeota archaeon]|nr:sulfatase-like hydrolase/transferase [Candidatus Lokiarchaeota archaeon]
MVNKKPNLILLTIDALRLDHLSIMGYKKKTSPYLDKLARKGFFFKQAITNGPWTLPSFSSIFTSIYPFHQGGYSPLPQNKTTLAEVLNLKGYKTIALHSTPVLSRFYGFDRGFDKFFDNMTNSETLLNNKIINKLYNKIADFFLNINVFKRIQYYILILFYNFIVGSVEYYKKAGSLFKKALRLIEKYKNGKDKKKPLFFWIHLMDPHDPYLPVEWSIKKINTNKLAQKEIKYIQEHPEYLSILREYEMTEKIMELYDGEIRYIDSKIRWFFNELKKRNWLKNTLTIITADHGEEFYERGQYGHNAQLYDELLRVPLIFISDKLKAIKNEQKKDINNIIDFRDLSPTILDLLGLPPEPNFDGKSFKELIISSEEKVDDPIEDGVFSETYHKNGNISFSNTKEETNRILSYRTTDWKYIINDADGVEKLYNLHDDPKELNDLSTENKKLLRIFRKKLIDHLKEKEKRKKNLKDIIERKKILKASKKIKLSI